MKRVDILMTTYNGGQFVAEQIESILAQSHKAWKLFIHDDGSTDDTLDVIRRFAAEYPDQISLLEDGVRCGGAKENFSHLMASAEADYVMFCDQDDVWFANKVELTLQRMLETEQTYPDVPLIVHSDLQVVNETLSVISESMFWDQKLRKEVFHLNDIIMCNNVTGCTMMMNARLMAMVSAVPAAAVMHDWWLACFTLANNGRIEFVDRPLIAYRQHGKNTVGFKKYDLSFVVNKLLRVGQVWKNFNASCAQARTLGCFSSTGLFLNKIKCILFRLS